jgi:hypothetical protein
MQINLHAVTLAPQGLHPDFADLQIFLNIFFFFSSLRQNE